MKGRALAVVYALVFGGLLVNGVPSCTLSVAPPIPPMGYNQQVCLSIGSPIQDSCVVPDPAAKTVPVTLELNSTFELRPPGSCATNALNNCGHAVFFLDGKLVGESADMVTEIPLNDRAVPYGKRTITALLVDDCGIPWTLVWNDAGVLYDGGIMCLPPDAGMTAPLDASVTNTCSADMLPDAAVDIGPYFASVTIDVKPSCGDGG